MKTVINPEYKYSELTGKIIGCAIEVHKTLGAGFQEKIYQRAMAIEMSRQGISFNQEFEMTVFYKGEITGTRRVDFLVEDIVSVEFKARTQFDDANLNQGINYLEAMRLEIGLLFNFGTKKLTIKRLINSKHLNPEG